MARAQGVRPREARLGLAAADVAACRAESKVEAASALLALVGGWGGPFIGDVRAVDVRRARRIGSRVHGADLPAGVVSHIVHCSHHDALTRALGVTLARTAEGGRTRAGPLDGDTRHQREKEPSNLLDVDVEDLDDALVGDCCVIVLQAGIVVGHQGDVDEADPSGPWQKPRIRRLKGRP